MWRVVVGMLLAAGCGDAAARITCPGERPPIESCFQGVFFAECGGDGEPLLGCTEDDCRWFADGCVAAGYEASNCPADDICCHDDWPFEDDGFYPSSPLNGSLFWYGSAPRDRTTEVVVPVTVDAALKGETSVSCDGPPPRDGTPCEWPRMGAGMYLTQDTLAGVLWNEGWFGGWQPSIEIIPQPDGPLAARVCAEPFTDFLPQSCGLPIVCASSGTARLNRWPSGPEDLAGVVIEFDVTFPNGFHLVVTLAPTET